MREALPLARNFCDVYKGGNDSKVDPLHFAVESESVSPKRVLSAK